MLFYFYFARKRPFFVFFLIGVNFQPKFLHKFYLNETREQKCNKIVKEIGFCVMLYFWFNGKHFSSFNAATTQIIPFLTLGIGVDNMFMLLHNYSLVLKNNKHNEIGMLMKETGMSILLTSVNNILSFLTGTILPIPALRSFCTQVCIHYSNRLLILYFSHRFY